MSNQKKIMLLGGLRYLLPVIEEAHRMGVYVITADYLPDNIAHKYSDEYVNVSIVDKDAVLKVAQEKQIDGILSFAVDPGVVTAAYVAEQMGLPFQCSYQAATILQNKVRFRTLLRDNDFHCPWFKGYSSVEQVLADQDSLPYPVIVKPADSAGSKGVTKVEDKRDLSQAADFALQNSISGECIVEKLLDTVGYQSSKDVFTVDGRLAYVCYSDQLFDRNAANPYTPAVEIWPSTMDKTHQDDMSMQLQRLVSLLGMTTGIYNVEARVCSDGKAYIMEVSPRGGGNRIAELQDRATSQHLIRAEIQKALSLPLETITQPVFDGVWCNYILHVYKEGHFAGMKIDNRFRAEHVMDEALTVAAGDKVHPFTGANTSLGTLFLRFDTRKHLEASLLQMDQHVNIELQ